MTLVLLVISILTIGYFIALSAIYIFFTTLAWRGVTNHMHGDGYAGADEAFASTLVPPISILLPGYNEEAGIVESVHSLLSLRYPEFEVLVINDGSSDGTLDQLRDAFDLVPIRKTLRSSISTAAVRGTYVGRRRPELVVIDKANGGKADALNAGLNAARHPYVCAVDADAILEPDALLRVAKPVLDDPDLVVASGGIVRIANGCRVEHGQVVEVGLPRNRLATLQVVEYFRAFLVGRMGWTRLGSLLIISGAFGLFRRSAVEDVGGWWTGTVGEDMELVVRLHRHFRDRGEPYKIVFVPDPVCWTEAPEDLGTLSRQRRRWQRGLGETLWCHRAVLGRPRYGALGLLAFPYFLIFELLGPVIQALGLPVVLLAAVTDRLSYAFLLAFFVLSLVLGALLSIAALAIEEFSFRRHSRHRDVLRMLAFAVLENLGYRQLVSVWGLLGFVDLLRKKQGWGAQKRLGLVRQPGGAAAGGASPAGGATPSVLGPTGLNAQPRHRIADSGLAPREMQATDVHIIQEVSIPYPGIRTGPRQAVSRRG